MNTRAVDGRRYGYTPCPMCGAVAVRPVGLPRRVPTFPPGHEVLWRWGGFVVDRCPRVAS